MEQPANPNQDRTKWLIALGGLVGLCVISLLCAAIFGGAYFIGQRGDAAQTPADRPGIDGDNPNIGSNDGNTLEPIAKGSNDLVMLGGEPPTLDPALASDATSANYIVEIFSGLVTLNTDLEIVPDIASEWQTSEDGTVYTFTLRDDAQFANGTPVTAADFKYSIERACDPQTQSPVADTYLGDIVGCREKLRGTATEVSGVQAVNDTTLEITIDAPKVYFLAKLTYPTAFVVDQETVEAEGRLWATSTPNGTGPFMLEAYEFGDRITLVPNPNYYGDPKPSIDRAVFILSGGSSMTMYETNEVDISGIGVADIDRVLDPSSELNSDLREVTTFSVGYVGLNSNQPPFDDPLVRQAFNLATDRETLVRVVGRGITIPANGVLPPGFPGYNEDLQGLEFDPERAQQLLAESSYGGAENLPDITIHVAGAGTASEEVEALVSMWQENLGVTVNIEVTEWATFLYDIAQKPNPYQMYNVAWIADYPDPQNFLDILFYCDSLDNKSGYCNEEVDSLLEQARVEQDQEARFALYQQAEQIIVNDGAWIPIAFSKGYVLVKPWVQNYVFPPAIVSKLKYVEITQ